MVSCGPVTVRGNTVTIHIQKVLSDALKVYGYGLISGFPPPLSTQTAEDYIYYRIYEGFSRIFGIPDRALVEAIQEAVKTIMNKDDMLKMINTVSNVILWDHLEQADKSILTFRILSKAWGVSVYSLNLSSVESRRDDLKTFKQH